MNLLTDGADGFKALQMAVQVPERTNELAVPLFKLQEGIASCSAGLVCAKISGVKKSVIDRAREIVTAMRSGERVQPLTEILDNELGYSHRSKQLFAHFLKANWKDSSDDDVLRFREEVMRL